ncbi:MAG TPA: DUF1365 domain-containing protein [Gammaproteobacteria bacterium]|nr:DUF1365 domain-containing protein [Gammaproteobacteria bacterium]
MHSRIYVGQVRHHRYLPVAHAFRYGMFMLYLDLDELPFLFSKRWLWSATRPAIARFRRADHLGDAATDLATAVRTLVRETTGITLRGPVRLLTHLRYFGCGFNPVSFYYCFDPHGEQLEAIVAEVNNTPWGQQHCYILPESGNLGDAAVKRHLVDKRFHVSPFIGMNIDYDWRFTRPAEKLLVHMKNYQQGELLFDATLTLREQQINGYSLASVLVRYPFMTVKVIAAIYYQALRLWLKKIPFVPHPDRQEAPDTVRRP